MNDYSAITRPSRDAPRQRATRRDRQDAAHLARLAAHAERVQKELLRRATKGMP